MTSSLQSFDEILQIGKEVFCKTFDSNPTIGVRAPGRVNLIGEHVDYNDGFVLPMALPMVTVILGSPNGSQSTCDIITLCSNIDEPKRVQFDANTVEVGSPKWLNYIKGVIKSFGQSVPGFNAIVISNVPVGGGLSSSAALEVSTLTFLEELTQKRSERLTDKALICQKAEHDFAGMPCGIMDQLISVMGKKSNALLIDCRSLETFQIPFKTKDLAVLICNSNVRHELNNSEYSNRRKECNEALKFLGLKTYREATVDHLSALNLAGNLLLKRARHVITEIKRTCEAATALREQDFKKMGKLMTESHLSLRDDFEVSCPELDILVDSAINCDGVLGSRMTGGGFGGCTVTLVQTKCVDNVISTMRKAFKEKCNGRADFYVCTPSDGAQAFKC